MKQRKNPGNSQPQQQSSEPDDNRFRGLVETISDRVWEMDRRYMYTYICPKVRDVTGYEPVEMIGKTFHAFMQREEAIRFEKLLDEIIALPQPRAGITFNHFHKDGRLLTFTTAVCPLFDSKGEICGFVGADRSIRVAEKTDNGTEKKLMESEEQYRRIFETTPAGIFQYDTELRLIHCNDRFISILQSTREKLIGLDMNSLKDTNVLPAITRALEGQEGDYEGRYQTTTSDTDVWISMRTSPLLNVNGQVLGGIGIVQDITERMRFEEALAEREQRYRRLFDLSPSGILLEDANGTIIDINDSLCRSFRYRKDELLGKNVSILVPPEEVKTTRHNLENVLAGKTLEHVEVNLRKDGTRCSMELRETGVTLPDGKKGILVVANDITERLKADDALEESEQRYRQLVDLSPDAIAVHSGGKIVFVNQAGIKLFGASAPEELIGRSIFDVVHPDSRDIVRERVRMMTSEGIRVPVMEEKFMRLDGKKIDVDVVAMPFVYRGIPSIQVVIRDITEREIADKALRDSEERYRTLIENQGEGVAIIDLDGKFRFVNPAGEKIFAMTYLTNLI
jgi:PAS domain S-box-containing protein